MTWIILTAIGIWIALSAFILLMLCMNSSRLSQLKAPAKRRISASPQRKRIASRAQPSPASITGD